MHSGTANGGHYFSYIRSEQGPFFEFNDTNVWHAPDNALEQAYGGGKGACAYLLIYRSRELELARVKGSEGADSLLSLEELEKEATAADGGWKLMKERGVRGVDDEKKERRLRRVAEVALLPPAVRAIVDAEDEVHLKQHAEQERERRRLEVTVVYGTSEHTCHFDQEQRMSDCLASASSHFVLPPDTPLDRLRFRRYDRQHEWSAEPYPAALTLIQCHFSKRSTVRLEVRQEGQEWPAFNPNLIPLRVIHAHPDNLQSIIEHAASYPHSSDSVTLSVDCTQPLSALSSLLEPVFSIPLHRQRLIRLHDDRGEVIADLTVTPQSLHLTAGHLLYVEDTGEALEDASTTDAQASVSPLCRELDLSKCQIKLLFNLPIQPDADDASTPSDALEGTTYEQAVHVSKHQSVRYLKSLISPIVSLPPDAFRLSRNESSAHFKDLDATLTQVGLVDYSAVHVSVGRQCERDEFNLKVFLLQSTAPARSSSSYLHLFDLPIPSSSTISQLKVAMLAHLNAQFGDVRGTGNGIGLTFFRLREKKGHLSSRVFEDARTVTELLQDEADVCIERCGSEEEARVNKESCLIRWAWWDGKALGPEREMLVKKMVMVGAVREEIRSAWRLQPQQPRSGPCPPLFLAKGMARVRMRPADVAKVQWMGEEDLADTKLAKNLPLRIAAGDLLIATLIPPSSHTPKLSTPPSIPEAAPDAPPLNLPPPPLDLPPPPPPAPPGPPLAPSMGAAAAVSVNKPPESVISAARSRLKRAVGVKGVGEGGVLVKGARVYPAREYGLHIDNIEDEIEAIERACAEADRLEREKREGEEQQNMAAGSASEVEQPPSSAAPALHKEPEEHKDLELAE